MRAPLQRQFIPVFLGLWWILTGAETPDQPMDLGAAVRYAVAHSPRLAKADALVRVRDLEADSAAARLFPSLDLSADHGLEKTLPTPPVQADEAPVVSRLGLSLTQPLYDNGETSTRREVASLQRELALVAKAKARDDLVLDVARNFYRLSLTDILLTIKRRQQELLSKQYRLMHAQYRQGLKTKKDFLRFQTETQRASIAVEQAVSARQDAETQLAKLLGMNSGEASPTFATLSPETVVKGKPGFPEKAPDIKTSHPYRQHVLDAKVAAQNFELVRRKNSPEVTLGAGANYGNSGYLNSDDPPYAKDSVSWNIMLGFKYNLWDRGTRRRDEEIAAIQSRVADLEAETQLADLDASLRALMTTLESLQSSHKLGKELLELEETSYQHLESEYRQGRVPYLDLITALGDLLSARVGYYTTYTTILENLAQYRYHEGTLYETLAAP